MLKNNIYSKIVIHEKTLQVHLYYFLDEYDLEYYFFSREVMKESM